VWLLHGFHLPLNGWRLAQALQSGSRATLLKSSSLFLRWTKTPDEVRGWSMIIHRVVMEGPMEALLTAFTLWLSTSFILPATFDHPRIEFVSSKEMTALFYEGIGRQEQAGMVSDPSDIVSCTAMNRKRSTCSMAGVLKHPLSYRF
jgi:hypothetical protein